MPDPVVLPPAELSRRIVVGLGLVYELFWEMNVLFRLLRKGLEEADAGIKVHSGKGYQLRRGTHHVTVADRFVRTDMGMFATIGDVAGEDGGPDDEEDETEEAGEDDDESAADKAHVAITPDTRVLGVRAVLYDRSLADPLSFTPVVIAAVLSAFSRRASGQQTREATFQTSRANVKKFVKQLHPGITAATPLATRITRHEMAARVGAVHEVQLASLTSERDVQNYIDAVLEMIERTKNP